MRFAEDDDWFRATLAVGATYDVSVVGSLDGGEVARILDGRGRVLATAVCWNDRQPCLTFAAPASGSYYLSVQGHSDAMPTYELTLRVSR